MRERDLKAAHERIRQLERINDTQAQVITECWVKAAMQERKIEKLRALIQDDPKPQPQTAWERAERMWRGCD